MKYVDRAFALTLIAFALGSVLGAVAALTLPPVDLLVGGLVAVRVVGPLRAVSTLGSAALVLLVFVNNVLVVSLSFLYPLILGKARWTPTPSVKAMRRLLAWYSLLVGSTIGFFNLGAILGWAWLTGGPSLLGTLVAASWLHAPIEFVAVLVSVAEPLRISPAPNRKVIPRSLRLDLPLAVTSVIFLLGSAIIEVLLRL